jgi:hypothetical protein
LKNAFLISTALALVAVAPVPVMAQQSRPATPVPYEGPAENSLIGISLFDNGQKLLARWGSPEQIIPLSVSGVGGGGGGGGAAPAPGGGPGGLPPSGGAGRRANGGDEVDAARPTLPGILGDPFGEDNFQKARASDAIGSGGGGAPVAPRGGPGPIGPGGGGAVAAGGGAPAGGGAGPSGTSTYTRWVYNKDDSKYAFVLDQNNRIIQIEALGIKNSRVRTRKGVSFGSTFAQVMKSYNSPEQYEFGGGNLVMKYLVKYRVVFRLAKLDAKKPHVVTGIVIAAGKD